MPKNTESLNNWTEVLVTTDNKKDMSYSFTFKNLKGQNICRCHRDDATSPT